LNLALIGYGKMGKLIESVALSRGHQIVCIITSQSGPKEWEQLKLADVAIEITQPKAAFANIEKCFDANVPVAVGTTGWYDQLDKIKQRCVNENQTLLCATNFSIGVNVVYHINKILAGLMEQFPEYDVKIEEIHHTKKLDAPSGTAISLAEGILQNISRKNKWNLSDGTTAESDLAITALRVDEVPGTHTVTYSSAIDDIELKHTAHNRLGFSTGAVVAAEWLQHKKGFYTMNDLLGF
jgi:4-hydroxy-tetrahydrodipicolinate reductase